MANVQQQVVNGVKTLNIHGKSYVEVAERVNQVHEAKAEFDILQSEPVQVGDRWLWKSVITINGHEYRGSAEVKMNAPKNTPDGTNPFECAETSAIGRALGFAGFGSVDSIASKDEIERGKPFNNAPVEATEPAATPRTQATRPAQPTNTIKPVVAASNSTAQPAKADRAVSDMPQSNPEVNRLKSHAIEIGLAHNLAEWMAYKERVLGKQIKDIDLQDKDIRTLRAAMDHEQAAKAS